MKIISTLTACLLLAAAPLGAEETIVFEDFEGADYGDWTVEGDAFGTAPAQGTLPDQKTVTGFEGKGLVNTFVDKDRSTGTLTSPVFTIERDFILFRIGGGGSRETALQLLVDGKVVQSASGEYNAQLYEKSFDVSDLQGQKARLRIVDQRSSGWGHVFVDHIVFAAQKPKNPWNIGKAGAPPYNPYKIPSDYKEPWRPQFHFSPKNEWMNDINALIYHDGTYHMLYQWGKAIRHGGYATSKDLIHWEDKGVALVPQNTFLPPDAVRNVSGAEVWSGSGVVISGEAARKVTGSDKTALLMIYTGTNVGTCIAWSNDDGATWHNFESNPVANPTAKADPRDPCVIWYPPTESWVMGIYENGTTFYGSKDLIEWEELSNINFGFECPDLVELPLDGDPNNMKWVLYDAAGKYLVGNFDGTTFIDENKSKKPLFMDLGPDFYAGQTFFPHNLPEKKYIQIAWMSEWNGGVGEKPWLRNATFPVELGLVTRDGQMRVTRTPIDAIQKLYTGDPFTLSGQEMGSENVLKGINSKAFDLTLEIDLNQTTASEITFSVTNIDYRYDVANNTLHYEGIEKNKYGSKEPPTLLPDSDNVLRLRMLVDWSSIEMFAEGGVFTFSHHVGFDPKDDSLSLTATGGKAKINHLKLQNLKSIWK